MTNNQKKVYNWLMDRTGYLKNSSVSIQLAMGTSIALSDISVALKKAYQDNKNGAKVISSTTKVVKEAVRQRERQMIISSSLKGVVNKHRNTPGTYYITGCAHAPWQNKRMYDANINYLNKEVDLQGIILAGDILDLNSLSSHDKGKVPIKGVTLDWEYKEANKFLDQFDELKVKGTKDYIYGNHEDRYNRIVKDSDVAKFGSSLISPDEALCLKARGYNVYKDWKNDVIHLGPHLDVMHGEFFNVHTCKKTIDTYRHSALYFHTHRLQVFVEGLVGGFNMGFGGDIDAAIFNFASRAMKNSWINASCNVTLDKDGFYHVEPLMFINNKLIVNGKEY